MIVCEQCGSRRLQSRIVERAHGRMVSVECQSCGKHTSRWIGDHQPPANAPATQTDHSRKRSI